MKYLSPAEQTKIAEIIGDNLNKWNPLEVWDIPELESFPRKNDSSWATVTCAELNDPEIRNSFEIPIPTLPKENLRSIYNLTLSQYR